MIVTRMMVTKMKLAKTFSRFAAALLCLWMATSPLAATTIVPMSVERLTRASTHVVVGEAADSWTEWNAERTLIYTVTRIRVRRALKGDAGQTIFVKQLGGVSGAYQQKVAGVRYWQEGEQSVLFVHPAQGNDGRFVITGLMQGNFAVRSAGADPEVTNGIEGVEAFDPRTKTVKTYRGSTLRLSQLEARVKKAATE
ncbi:MAG: hypothetical protein ABIP81_06430 [Terriglobales bacterium]